MGVGSEITTTVLLTFLFFLLLLWLIQLQKLLQQQGQQEEPSSVLGSTPQRLNLDEISALFYIHTQGGSNGFEYLSLLEMLLVMLSGELGEKLRDWAEENEKRLKELEEKRAENNERRPPEDDVRKETDDIRDANEKGIKDANEEASERDDKTRTTQPPLDDELRNRMNEMKQLIEDTVKAGVEGADERIDSTRTTQPPLGDELRNRMNEMKQLIEDTVKAGVEGADEKIDSTRTTQPPLGDELRNRMNQMKQLIEDTVKAGVEGADEKIDSTRTTQPPIVDEVRKGLDTSKLNSEDMIKQGGNAGGDKIPIRRLMTNPELLTMMVEEGGRPRPKSSSDPSRPINLQDLASMRYDVTKFANRGLVLSARAIVALGHIPSLPFIALEKGAGLFAQLIGASIQSARTTFTSSTITSDDVRTAALKNIKNGSNLGKLAKIRTAEIVGTILEKVGPILDVLMIVQTFAEPAFEGVFPSPSEIVGPETFTNTINMGINTQISLFADQNIKFQELNSTCDPTQDTDCPYMYVQYPIVAGPLDDIDMGPTTNSDPWWNKIRVQTMIDAVREKLLRDTTQPYNSQMKQLMSTTGVSYTDVVGAPDDSLVNYVDQLFDGKTSDALYQEAFTQVCTKYGGIVYIDNYYMGPGATVCSHANYVAGTCDVSNNRKRFQCGYTSTDCYTHSNNWSQATYGHYSEFFTPSDMNKYMSSIDDILDPDYQTTPAPKMKLQPGFANGACLITSPSVKSFCDSSYGNYDPIARSCTYTPRYCQSIGTCYCTDTKTCFLPYNSIEALAFFLGQNTVRELIRENGCVTTPGTSCTDGVTFGIGTTTSGDGEDFHGKVIGLKEWGENMKKELTNPLAALMFVGSVQGLIQSTTEFGSLEPITDWIAAQGASSLATAGAADAGVAAGASEAVAGAATAEATATATAAAGEVAGLTLMSAASAAFGVAAIGVALAMIGMIAVQAIQAAQNKQEQPSRDPNEYTVGGWTVSNNQSVPRRLGFVDGWVTKPIKYHGTSYTTVGNPKQNVDAFEIVTKIKFFTDHNNCPRFFGYYDVYTCIISQTVGQNICSQLIDGAGNIHYEYAPNSQGNLNGFAPAWIRGATNGNNSGGNANTIWCLPAFPITSATKGLFDPSIGTEASGSSSTRTSNTWTDGSDPSYAMAPIGSACQAGDSTNSAGWYYQLVYGKDTLAGAQTVPYTDGQGISRNKFVNPTKLWDDAYLQKYFSFNTINSMRMYFCQKQLATDVTGQTVDSTCWGYLFVSYKNWTFRPMTLPVTS